MENICYVLRVTCNESSFFPIMSFAKHFTDLEIWKEGMEVARIIYGLTQGSSFSKDFGLTDQIRRAAVSISSNIAEGFERRSKKEFAQFLVNAKGSVGEVRSQLFFCAELGKIPKDTNLELQERLIHLGTRIGAFIAKLSWKREPAIRNPPLAT